MDNIAKEYFDLAKDRQQRGLPLGDCCEYCGSTGTRTKSNYSDDEVCSSCGAFMPHIFLTVFGMPVYDAMDAYRLEMEFWRQGVFLHG